MAAKRPNTIGTNPLKSSTAKSLASEASVPSSPAQAPSEAAESRPKRPRASKKANVEAESGLPQQSPGMKARVRRTTKATEALFEEQLRRDKVLDFEEAGADTGAGINADSNENPKADADINQEAAALNSEDAAMSDRHLKAMAVVKTWSQWAVVAGMTPLPLLDTLALSGTQIKMIQLLCKHYDVPFERKVAIAVATGLVGGSATSTIATGITRAMMRNIPIAGQIFNWTVEPALSYASTYAIGATFVRHFEASGNLMSFKAEQMKAYAAEQYQKGKSLFLSKKRASAA